MLESVFILYYKEVMVVLSGLDSPLKFPGRRFGGGARICLCNTLLTLVNLE